MSLFGLGRYGASLAKANRTRRDRAILDSLSPEIQADIGWPIRRPHRDDLLLTILMSGR